MTALDYVRASNRFSDPNLQESPRDFFRRTAIAVAVVSAASGIRALVEALS